MVDLVVVCITLGNNCMVMGHTVAQYTDHISQIEKRVYEVGG